MYLYMFTEYFTPVNAQEHKLLGKCTVSLFLELTQTSSLITKRHSQLIVLTSYLVLADMTVEMVFFGVHYSASTVKYESFVKENSQFYNSR